MDSRCLNALFECNDEKTFKILCEFATHRRIFARVSECSNFISKLNAALDEKDHRGFSILNAYLPHCCNDVFSENAADWMMKCVKSSAGTLENNVLRSLIKKSIHFPELRKNISGLVAPKFFQLISNNQTVSEHTLHANFCCIVAFMRCYSSLCGSYVTTIKKYALHCLRTYPDSPVISDPAALCFALLPQCGVKGKLGCLYKEAWTNQLRSICSSAHLLIDATFSNISILDLYAYNDSFRDMALVDLVELDEYNFKTPADRYKDLREKVRVTLNIMRTMFLCGFPVGKVFDPSEVFDVIGRLLSVSCDSIENLEGLSIDNVFLNAILVDLHISAYKTMEALSLCAKRDLIKYGNLICKLGLQSLKWTTTKDWPYGQDKPYKKLRIAVYKSLLTWMSVSGTCSFIEASVDELIPLILTDVKFDKPLIKLVANKRGKKGKQKHKRDLTEMRIRSELDAWRDIGANKTVCKYGLRTLRCMLVCSYPFLKWEQHENLQKIVIGLLLDVVKSNCLRDYPIPYAEEDCRLELYKALWALVENSHPKWPSPIYHASFIFKSGKNDSYHRIVKFSYEVSSKLDFAIHPRAATLYFSMKMERELKKEEPCLEIQECEEENEIPQADSTQVLTEATISTQNSKCVQFLIEPFTKESELSSVTREPVEVQDLELSIVGTTDYTGEMEFCQEIKQISPIVEQKMEECEREKSPEIGKDLQSMMEDFVDVLR